jgi:hypothetical protein
MGYAIELIKPKKFGENLLLFLNSTWLSFQADNVDAGFYLSY